MTEQPLHPLVVAVQRRCLSALLMMPNASRDLAWAAANAPDPDLALSALRDAVTLRERGTP